MSRFSLLLLLTHFLAIANSQNNLPATYLFNEPPTSIYAQTIYNDTIVCMGVAFLEGDSINHQQGAFIAFIDSCGNLIHYRKYFDAQGRDIILNLSNKIIRTKNGWYCFVGLVEDETLVIMTNSTGDSIFMRSYSIPNEFDYASFMSIHEINNSLYVIGFGGTQSPIEDDLFMVKFDLAGNQLNFWRFQTSENCEYFQDAIVKGNDIIISAAQTNACVSGVLKSKTRIFEVDTSGNILWNWVDNDSNLKRGGGLGLKSTPDGGWIYAGAYNDTFYSAIQFDRLFVTKIDYNRNHEWTRIVGYQEDSYNYSYFRDITVDAEGNFIVAGQYKTGHPDFPTSNPAICAIIMKLTSTGEILWTNIAKAFENGPGNGMTMLTSNVNLLSSGNIIIGGYLYRSLSLGPQNEGWLAKISPNGEVLDDLDPVCGFVTVKQPVSVTLGEIRGYPNPAKDYLQFNLSQLPVEIGFRQVIIYDLLGKIIAQAPPSSSRVDIIMDTSNIPNGIYIYRIVCAQTLIQVGKFIVEKP